MNAKTRNIKFLVAGFALLLGFFSGYSMENAEAVPTTCCTNCNDYCKCDNVKVHEYSPVRARCVPHPGVRCVPQVGPDVFPT
jgi:hypothetical protein